MPRERIEVLWPEHRFVLPETLITWASDDVSDGAHDGPATKTLQDAIEMLLETESVTFTTEIENYRAH